MVLPNLQMLDVALLDSLIAAAPSTNLKKIGGSVFVVTLFGIFCC
jgi:hypothetical protein